MKVSDIMTREVITVKKDTSLTEAARLLAKYRLHGMPVVDETDKVIGIVTENDFFTKDNIYLPTFLEFISKIPTETVKGANTAYIEQTSTVGDIMTEDCLTVKPDLTIEKLIVLIKNKNLNTFPVIDDRNVLVGIVTIMDVIELL